MAVSIVPAYGALDEIRALFTEYTDSLGFDLSFQNYQEEVQNLPGEYALPGGRLYLAGVDGNPAGCVALRPFQEDVCEIKRLFVRPAFRGHGLGRLLVQTVIDDAAAIGYKAILLDSLQRLQSSVALYHSLGFKTVPPYRHNPIPGAVFLRLDL